MNLKVKVVGLLTICLLAFQTLPAIANESNAGPINNQNTYQQLLKENTTTNQVLNSPTQDSDKKKAENLLENTSLSENQANLPTQDSDKKMAKSPLENTSLSENQANLSTQDSDKKMAKSPLENTSLFGTDLVPFTPSGWGDKLIVTKNPGQLYSDTSFSPNDQLYFSYACINNGTLPTPTTTVYNKFYVDNTLISTRYFSGPLDPSWYVTGNDIVLGNLSSGNHTLKMVIDATNVVTETDEDNNEYSVTINVEGNNIDLQPYQPTAWGDKLIVTKNQGQLYSDTSFSPNDQLYFSYACINSGTSPTPTTTVYNKFYVDNTLISTRYFSGPLDPSWYVTGNDIVLGNLSAGNHTLKMVVDATNAVTETNESNNEYSITIKVDSSDSVDLVPYKPSGWGDKLIVTKNQGQLYSDTSFSPNDQLYFSYACINSGTSPTPTTTVYNKFYVDNTLISTRYFSGPLDPNWYVTGNDIVLGNLSAGNHTLKMVVDATNVVTETNESNNEYSVTVTIDSGNSIDLVPYKPTSWGDKLIVTKNQGQLYTDTSLTSNDELYVNYAYINNSSASTPYTTVQSKIYVDNIEQFTSDFQGTIQANYYVFLTNSKSIGNLSAGNHTIKMVIDTTNAINETNESNNEYSITVNVVPDTVVVHPTSVSLNKSSATITMGHTEQLSPTVFPSNATNKDVTWNSSNPSVATVDSTGLITAVSPGENVRITVNTTDGNKQAYCYVTVTGSPKTVKTLTANPSSLNLMIEEDAYITLTATYTDGSREDVTELATWKSSQPQFATVDEYGMVTSVANGSTTITGTYGGKTATIPVTVGSPKTVKTLKADPSSLNLTIDEDVYITLTATYTDGSREDVTELATWNSSKPQFATVDEYGMVTGIANGSTTITGTYGGKIATIPATVGSLNTVKTLKADPSSLTLMPDEDAYITLTATYTDNSREDVTELATWESSKPQFATVDEYGMVTGIANGSTTITGTYGGKTATIPVTVDDGSTPVLVGITAQPDSVNVGYLKTQAVKIYAEYSNDTKVDVTTLATLESLDPAIATVTRGMIKGLCVGDTSISVTYLEQTTEISVTVTPPVTKLTADPPVLSLVIDESETINLTATFKDKTEEEVTEFATWKSSSPKIATVNEYGEVTGVALGSTTITGTYGGKTATIKVNVTPEIDHFIVKPGCVGVAKGKTQVVNIYAVYADEDSTMVDITKMVQLTSEDTEIATVKGTTVKGVQADSETILTGTYLDQDLDIEIPVKVTQPLKTLETDAGTAGLNLSIGDYENIILTATYADGYDEEVSDCATGISSKPGVATVDIEDGVITVTAVSRGSAKITLSYEGKKVIVNVTVTE